MQRPGRIRKLAGQKFAADHMDREWMKTLWSEGTKTELCGYNEQQYVYR